MNKRPVSQLNYYLGSGQVGFSSKNSRSHECLDNPDRHRGFLLEQESKEAG
jgi:hypothetical protein